MAEHDPDVYRWMIRRRVATAPPRSLATLVRDAYPDPRTFDTVEAFARTHHDDVRYLTDEQIADERFLAYLRRACDRPPSAWLRERITRLDAEWTRRKQPRKRS